MGIIRFSVRSMTVLAANIKNGGAKEIKKKKRKENKGLKRHVSQ